jgi:hypothetical protein
MDILSESEIQEINTNSKLVKKCELIDRESAYELLNKNRLAEAEATKKVAIEKKRSQQTPKTTTKQGPSTEKW